MVSIEVRLCFLSSLEHFWPDLYDTLSKVALFFEKMHKVFKNKAQGCSTPLKTQNSLNICYTEICTSINAHILPRVFGNLYFCLYLLQFHS